jgi:DNA-binding transcriptional regulator of glucitol operon
MSLKTFHIVFIILSVALCLFFAVWQIDSYNHGGNFLTLISIILGFLTASGLLVYGKMFLKKFSHINFL